MVDNVIIFDGVTFEDEPLIEAFCCVGTPPRNHVPGELKTHFGLKACIRSHSVIYAGNKIGSNFQTGNKVNIRELNNIGNDVSIGTLSIVEHHVTIGNGVRIHSQVFIPEYSILEENCWLGPNVVLTNAQYPMSQSAKENLKGPVIKRKAKIGANVTILPGVVIGENSLVGAGSVVTKNVPENAVVVGNPAKIINYIYNLPYGEK